MSAVFNPQPKSPEYLNRRLLDLAHREDAECGNCGYVGPCDPAHGNSLEFGKGLSHKADDCFFAFLCPGPTGCHRFLDQPIGNAMDPTGTYRATREDRAELFVRAMHRTWLLLWRRGWIKVSK